MLGISIKSTIGIGDGIQFSSVPENYYQETGKKLIDISKPWFFDHNPYVIRDGTPEKKIEMWNFSPKQWNWPVLRSHGVYLSNAEIFAAVVGVKYPMLNRPRLYKFEEFPFNERSMIVLQTRGKSHGDMPDHVLEHVLKKYMPTGQLCHIGPGPVPVGVMHMPTPTLWSLAELISKSRMFIGLDSGPSWVAACYPDVVVKKIRTKPSTDDLKTWVPMSVDNIHSHWDDRCHQVFNASEHDVGFTSSYRKI